MTKDHAPPVRPRRARRLRVVGLLVVAAAIAPVADCQVPATSPSTATAPVDVPGLRRSAAARDAAAAIPAAAPAVPPIRKQRGASGRAGGDLPDDTTVFDDEFPGIADLDAALLAALRRAATDAADDGIDVAVRSGWRSAEYQEQLLQQAISRYGSAAAAARWVATPEKSAHVSGEAVDLGPSDVMAWLSAHGADYGLCRIYRNEPWHFELRPDAVVSGCPAQYPDPSHDPRLQH